MAYKGLHNQKICAGEYQPQVTLVKNPKNCKSTNAKLESNSVLLGRKNKTDWKDRVATDIIQIS